MQLALTTESLCNIWNLCFVLIEFIFPFILTVTWVCDNIVEWSHSHSRLVLSHILTLPTRVDEEGVFFSNTLTIFFLLSSAKHTFQSKRVQQFLSY